MFVNLVDTEQKIKLRKTFIFNTCKCSNRNFQINISRELMGAGLPNYYHPIALWLPGITLKQVSVSYKNCLNGCD